MSFVSSPVLLSEIENEKVQLPVPSAPDQLRVQVGVRAELDIYARFMRHIRHVPNSRVEIKILSAIQFTADMADCSDAHVAKTLVEMGLRAPRMAFPADFLSYADQALMRGGWDVGAPSTALLDLKAHWDRIGEDKFSAFRGDFALLEGRAVYI
jgi:hypothetical protein